MSPVQFDRSPDLQRLRDEGYSVSVEESGYVLVRDVPYVTPAGVVARGILAYACTTSGETVTPPIDHVAFFVGHIPSKAGGQPLGLHSEGSWEIARDLIATYQLSAKNPQVPVDPDYYVKFTRYVTLLESQAQVIEPEITAKLFLPVTDSDAASPFMYPDSASSRAGIVEFAKRLEQERIAIVGLGGTGSYVLDLLAKTRIGEIHLFDGDDLLSHNAFRSPGAVSLEELNTRPKKAVYYVNRYSLIKKGLVPHPYFLDASNANELKDMDFVFLCMEGGEVKLQLVEAMESAGLSFIDVSLDVLVMGGALGGTVQVTTSTPGKRDHLRKRVSFATPKDDDIYSSNIQVADLNALNAVLAVIKWKKLCGFYLDLRHEHFTCYGIDQSMLVSEDEA